MPKYQNNLIAKLQKVSPSVPPHLIDETKPRLKTTRFCFMKCIMNLFLKQGFCPPCHLLSSHETCAELLKKRVLSTGKESAFNHGIHVSLSFCCAKKIIWFWWPLNCNFEHCVLLWLVFYPSWPLLDPLVIFNYSVPPTYCIKWGQRSLYTHIEVSKHNDESVFPLVYTFTQGSCLKYINVSFSPGWVFMVCHASCIDFQLDVKNIY